MIPASLRKQITAGETERTAFMSGAKPYQDIARTVCAFANTDGGTIFVGLDARGKPTEISEETRKALADLEIQLQADITPTPLVTVDPLAIGNASILVIEVPVGLDRPYAMDGAIYIRQGTKTCPADTYAIRDMVQTRAIEAIRWERRTASTLELNDLVHDEIRATVLSATRSNRFHFDDPDDDMSVLRDWSLISPSGFTQAADILFGRDPARRHPQCRARLIRYGSDKISRTASLSDRAFSGPIAIVFEALVNAVRDNFTVRSRFNAENPYREETPDFSYEALREGIMNALVHRDYASYSGGLTISLFPQRIEIWNAGRLPEELRGLQLAKVHQSLPTNPDIATVMHYRKLMEKVGRGTELIASESRKIGAKAPKWDDGPTGVTLTIFAAPFREFGTLPLNERQQAMLRQLKAGDQITPAGYRSAFADDVSERHARRDLTELVQDGYLVHIKAGANSAYRRTDLSFNDPKAH